MLETIAQPWPGRGVMLSEDLDRHISLHHALGFKFRTQALLLRNFVAYRPGPGP